MEQIGIRSASLFQLCRVRMLGRKMVIQCEYGEAQTLGEDRFGEAQEEEEIGFWVTDVVTATMEVKNCDIGVFGRLGLSERRLEDPVTCEGRAGDELVEI